MLLRRTTAALLLCTTIRHHSAVTQNLKSLSKSRKSKAIKQAQEALTEYLHNVRTIPFTFAENISKNSIVSLFGVISKVEFSSSEFPKLLERFFRYHPVNEFEFFFESIGINVNEIDGVLPDRKFFLSDDLKPFNAACTLYGLGIPWNRLGMLYKEEKTIFEKDPCELKQIWGKYVDLGFTSISLIGICLVFPHLLIGNSDVEALLYDLKRVIIDFDLINDVEKNVDVWVDLCKKIQMFYDLGCKNPKIGELMGRSKSIFLEYPKEILSKKIEYFRKFDVRNEEIAFLLLSKPEIFDFDLKSPIVSVLGLLKHFELGQEHLNSLNDKYPYVLGRNRLSNLPHVMRAMNLDRWLFDKIKNGDHYLLNNYTIGSLNEDFDQDFADCLLKIRSSRVQNHTLGKLEFLHCIGYGENHLTLKVLKNIHGTSSELQERFDCLIHNGFEFSKLCKMVYLSPKILNQKPESLEKKVKFLLEEIGSSLDYLDVFPAYLCFDLEKRIKPRYTFHKWLMTNELCQKDYSIASIIATSENSFIARVFRIHPAAPKKWLEIFTNPNYTSFQEKRVNF